MKKNTKNHGFSLIELMIVIAIIAILAAIAIPMYNNYINRTKIAKQIAAVENLETEVGEYYQNNNSYPKNLVALDPSYKDSTFADTDSQKVDLKDNTGEILITSQNPQNVSISLKPTQNPNKLISWTCTINGTGASKSIAPGGCVYSA